MSNSKSTNHKKANIDKTSTNKVNNKPINQQIYELLAQLIEISLLLVAFGIVVEILFGSVAPIGSGIVTNLVAILGDFGENGFTGLLALCIVIYIFKRAGAFAQN
jgi:hypothetical protein